jgi:peptidyl-prolyl cis-trans isomerase SurA
MKSFFIPALLLFFTLVTDHLKAQTLLTVGGEAVSKEEFLKAFRKNNVDSALNETSVCDYLELFIRFKLKVRAAAQAKIDTLVVQKAELEEFKSQLTESYLIDDSSLQGLVEEARIRSRKDIHLGHIFIAAGPGADTAFAARQANAAYKALEQGADFGRTAAEFSADTSSRNGDAGYITAFTLPYLFETVIYNLAPGKFSLPVRSKSGYHIFKNLGERPAAGRVKVSQILFASRPNATEAQVRELQTRADSVYTALQNGISFDELVQKYSDDNTSINAKGELPVFGPGTYDPAFETAAFALTKDGQISRPVRSAFGFHIIKRLQRQEPVENDSTRAALEEAVRLNERMEVSRAAFLKRVSSSVSVRESPVNWSRFAAQSDSILAGQAPKISAAQTLFSIGARPFDFGDWSKYLRNVRGIASITSGHSLREIFEQYRESALINYYRDNLEKYNKGYAAQLREFKEGNMLFEMMQRMVWDKAARDTAGLKRYFNANRAAYKWKPSADAIIFSALDSVSGYAFYQEVQKKPLKWRNSLITFSDKAQADSGRFELDQLPSGLENDISEIGKLTKPVANQGGSNIYSFLYIIKKYPADTPKTFDEATGAVLNDYQQYLEESWIKSLRTKYPVKVNESVLKTVWR